MNLIPLSVIIPVGEADESWPTVMESLARLKAGDEIIFVSKNPRLKTLLSDPRLAHLSVRIMASKEGRAAQLNAGARAARHEALWFVHCDTEFSAAAIESLREALRRDKKALYFFNLRFAEPRPRFMRLTEAGVRLRSGLLRIPFGDQAFSLSRSSMERLGYFDESAPYGEDHLLVWAAHRQGLRLKSLNPPVTTSARKYSTRGWFATTSLHLRLTVRQALPQLMRVIKSRIRP